MPPRHRFGRGAKQSPSDERKLVMIFKKTTKAQPFHELEASGTPASLSTLKEFFITMDWESDDQERSQNGHLQARLTSQMPSGEMVSGQMRQRLTSLPIIKRVIFEEIKVRFSNIRPLYQLPSTAMEASCSATVLVPVILVNCTKWMEKWLKSTTFKFLNRSQISK